MNRIKGQAMVEYALLTGLLGLGMVSVYYWYDAALYDLFWDIVSHWARQGP